MLLLLLLRSRPVDKFLHVYCPLMASKGCLKNLFDVILWRAGHYDSLAKNVRLQDLVGAWNGPCWDCNTGSVSFHSTFCWLKLLNISIVSKSSFCITFSSTSQKFNIVCSYCILLSNMSRRGACRCHFFFSCMIQLYMQKKWINYEACWLKSLKLLFRGCISVKISLRGTSGILYFVRAVASMINLAKINLMHIWSWIENRWYSLSYSLGPWFCLSHNISTIYENVLLIFIGFSLSSIQMLLIC
jgi:hypothetical protein